MTEITPDQLKQSEENIQGLRRRLEHAVDSEERALLAREVGAAEEAHRGLHQAYTAECQAIYMKKVISKF